MGRENVAWSQTTQLDSIADFQEPLEPVEFLYNICFGTHIISIRTVCDGFDSIPDFQELLEPVEFLYYICFGTHITSIRMVCDGFDSLADWFLIFRPRGPPPTHKTKRKIVKGRTGHSGWFLSNIIEYAKKLC